MATEHIEINSLERWEDAFSFPVQSIRKAELQLRRQINDRNERLRNKVGYEFIWGRSRIYHALTSDGDQIIVNF